MGGVPPGGLGVWLGLARRGRLLDAQSFHRHELRLITGSVDPRQECHQVADDVAETAAGSQGRAVWSTSRWAKNPDLTDVAAEPRSDVRSLAACEPSRQAPETSPHAMSAGWSRIRSERYFARTCDTLHAVRSVARNQGELMDVSMPITTVVPSLDGPVLAALAATASPLGLAAVHARTGRGSKSGVRSVLLRMVDEGLVLEVPGGYLLNRDHIAALAVELLASLHGELASRIRGAVEEWPTRPALVGMFGSAARRDGDSSSDIDVLVVSDDPDLDDRVDELAEQIRRWTGNRTQVIGRTPKEIARLRRAKEPILSEWTRDLVVIAGERTAFGKVV